MKQIRTRFAPSPTGFMHIGGVRTALYSYLIAKKNNGSFILRIEDTDLERYVEGSLEVIYDTLEDLGLNWDEGPNKGGPYAPYIQSERKSNYLNYAKRLIDEGKAYYCFCSNERLKKLKEEAKKKNELYKYDKKCQSLTLEEALKRINNGEKYVIRFKIPEKGLTVFEDLVYGKIEVQNKELEDLILIKSDGMPTYNFANIVDDYEMKITHIVRGNEYISSTPKYVLIYQAFGWETPNFVHLPIIKKERDSDKKLSKRDGDATVEALKEKGYLNEAIINMLALTGWSSGSEEEIFSLEELTKRFTIEGISKSNAIFDIGKLNWLNNYYIKRLTIDKLYSFVLPYLEEVYDLSSKTELWLKTLIETYQEQLSYGKEIVQLSELFFKEIVTDEDGKEFLELTETNNIKLVLKKEIKGIKNWTEENIKKALNKVKEETKVKGKNLFMPIRVLVSGKTKGPELPRTIFLLGQEQVIKRLEE
ncbi:MAG: glutamate--tRNA ligase [Bacilli bacterium]|jgi:nondiscriminating glutamyl-tRNA synthetase